MKARGEPRSAGPSSAPERLAKLTSREAGPSPLRQQADLPDLSLCHRVCSRAPYRSYRRVGARSLGPDPSLSVMSYIDLAHADRGLVNGNAELELPRSAHGRGPAVPIHVVLMTAVRGLGRRPRRRCGWLLPAWPGCARH